MLNSGRDSQFNSLGARAQSFICWTYEAQPAAGARDPILGYLLVNDWSSHGFLFTCFQLSRRLIFSNSDHYGYYNRQKLSAQCETC